MPATLSELLDNLYTTTWQNMKSEAADNIFDATPFWFWLKDKGKLESVEGGRFLTEPIVYDKNDNVKWTGKGGTTKLNDKEILTVSTWDWRYLVVPIVRFGVDDQQNRGKNAIMSLMNAKLENAKQALITELETRLFGGSGAKTAGTTTEDFPAFDGLQRLVADDPTAAATVGGIAQDTETWWRNKTQTLTSSSFATNGIAKMRSMLNNVSNNRAMDAPDIIVCGQNPYEYYEEASLSKLQITNTRLAEVGFANQTFKGIPMVWSPSCGLRMYFLNTRFIKFKYDPMMFFDLTSWKEIPDQINDRVAHNVTACGFVTSRRRAQGVIHTIDTP